MAVKKYNARGERLRPDGFRAFRSKDEHYLHSTLGPENFLSILNVAFERVYLMRRTLKNTWGIYMSSEEFYSRCENMRQGFIHETARILKRKIGYNTKDTDIQVIINTTYANIEEECRSIAIEYYSRGKEYIREPRRGYR